MNSIVKAEMGNPEKKTTRPLANKENPAKEGAQDTSARLVLLSGKGGKYEASDEQRKYLCLTDTFKLYVSGSHSYELCVQEYIERLGSNEVAYSLERVSLNQIQRFYDQSVQTGDSGKIVTLSTGRSNDSSELQKQIMRYIRQAVESKASDIHIVVGLRYTDIFFRVHGELGLAHQIESEQGFRLCSTIYQTMSDIAESTFIASESQDGRLSNEFAQQLGLFGGRIATRPTANGVQLVMRLLYQADERPRSLEGLRYLERQREDINNMIRRREGINILSGPTGSGKSTTLAVVLSMIASARPGDHILTIEDPCEYEIPGVRQTPLQIDRSRDKDQEKAIAVAWSSAISNSMRLDPDTMMIGEMRDTASALAAYRGAMTGHSIWTTLHANDPFSVLERLRDLQVDQSLLTDPTLTTGIISQRLVPMLCPHCKVSLLENYKSVPRDVLERMAQVCSEDAIENISLRGPGCKECGNKGISGRVCIAETVVPNKEIMDVFKTEGKAAARAFWLQELDGLSRSQHLAHTVNLGLVDPVIAERQICLLNEDTILLKGKAKK